MKKIQFTIILLLFMSANQTTNAQAVKQGDILIDAYYGFPNLYKSLLKTTYASAGSELNLKVGGFGPLGIRGEYMISDNVGIGIDIGFSNTNINYGEENFFYDPSTGETVNQVYDYEFNSRRLGAMVTFNYHFNLDIDNFDTYFMAGAGYKNRNSFSESNNPNFIEVSFSSVIPVAARVGVGARYFLNNNFAINFAIGLGQGGLINSGITYKILNYK